MKAVKWLKDVVSSLYMSEHWIIMDCDLVQIQHSDLYPETIQHFLENVVYNHPNKATMLRNLSNLYVLVAKKSQCNYLHKEDKGWKDIMNEREYEILEENEQLVISYMLTNEKYPNIHYIDYVDTIVRHQNLCQVMIDKYERMHGVILVPQEIIPSSAKYWAKMMDLGNLNKDDEFIVDKDIIDGYIFEFKLNKNDLKWKSLYDLAPGDDHAQCLLDAEVTA